jgi:hypothetical protein
MPRWHYGASQAIFGSSSSTHPGYKVKQNKRKTLHIITEDDATLSEDSADKDSH